MSEELYKKITDELVESDINPKSFRIILDILKKYIEEDKS